MDDPIDSGVRGSNGRKTAVAEPCGNCGALNDTAGYCWHCDRQVRGGAV